MYQSSPFLDSYLLYLQLSPPDSILLFIRPKIAKKKINYCSSAVFLSWLSVLYSSALQYQLQLMTFYLSLHFDMIFSLMEWLHKIIHCKATKHMQTLLVFPTENNQ